jgi:hypothetical protein
MRSILCFGFIFCLITTSCATKKNPSNVSEQVSTSNFTREHKLIISLIDTLSPRYQNYFVITRHTCSKCISEISEKMQDNNVPLCVIPIGFEAGEIARLNFLYNRRGISYVQVDSSLLVKLEQLNKSLAYNLQVGVKRRDKTYEIYNALEHMNKNLGVVNDSLAHFFLAK